MIQSMTGFGSAAFQIEGSAFVVEVRSVNHRHLDARARLPRPMAFLESDVRARISERFSRGKLDLSVVAPESGGLAPRLVVDLDTARQYLRAAGELAGAEGAEGGLRVAELLALPGVARFVEPELDAELLRSTVLAAADQALAALAEMRAAEGTALERDLVGRVGRVEELARTLEARAADVQQAVRERLQKRARQLAAEVGPLDEARLAQEVALAADRLDVTEEIVRLRSHADQFRKLVGGAGPGAPVGRRLDFLLQELGREANTIGAKGSDADVAHQIVELKTELERLREQVQNVE